MKQEMKNKLNDIARVEWNIIICALLLCSFGAIMIYSITGSLKDMVMQLVFMALGFGFILVFQFVNYNILKFLAKYIYGIGIFCIFALLTPLGVERNGATRWLKIGIQFQVAEAVKVAVIIMLAWIIWKYYGVANETKLTLLLWVAGGFPAVLLLTISNDLSSSVVVLGITFLTTFVCMKTLKLHLSIFALGVSGVGLYIWNIARNMPAPDKLEELPFRDQRIAAWLNPEMYASNQGYQPLQALYAIGRGGFFGNGLGSSIQKQSRLPEAQNDMVLAIVAEELGVFGIVVVVLLFIMLLFFVYMIATRGEKSIFGRVLAIGVFFHIAVQCIINISVVCGVFPNTGLPLPFISDGGMSLLCCLAELGILISVERRSVIRDVKKEINMEANS